MSDRELLELAAKGAGLDVSYQVKFGFHGRKNPPMCFYARAGGVREWSPLTDDGDRYRLAKACGLCVNFANKTVTAFIEGRQIALLYFGYADYRDGDEAECIVRAAAEIGKTMTTTPAQD